jgi:hypothetical protein
MAVSTSWRGRVPIYQRPLVRTFGWCGRRLCVPHPVHATQLILDPTMRSSTVRRKRVRQKPQVTSQRAKAKRSHRGDALVEEYLRFLRWSVWKLLDHPGRRGPGPDRPGDQQRVPLATGHARGAPFPARSLRRDPRARPPRQPA